MALVCPKLCINHLNLRSIHTSAIILSSSRVNHKIWKNWWVARWERERKDKNFPLDYTAPERPQMRSSFKECLLAGDMATLRYKYPEFLPANDPKFRNKVNDELQRDDMLKRREVVDIPEFYVGSILAVTVSDKYATGKISRFLGICICREGTGLRANFTLRNIIDHVGVEIRYDLYNPTIREIEVIKLEKRLDDELLYLRDADPEFSTFPMDMEPVPHNEEDPVPVNELKVRMKPHPWTKRWEVVYPKIKGIDKLTDVPDYLYNRTRPLHNRYEKFDLMKEYREHIPEEDQYKIWTTVKERLDKLSSFSKSERRRRTFQKL